jgi:hypothetical protein
VKLERDLPMKTTNGAELFADLNPQVFCSSHSMLAVRCPPDTLRQ